LRYALGGRPCAKGAGIRHALTRLLHHARRTGAASIAIEALDFTDSRCRERDGRDTRFRRLLARFPTAKLKARLVDGVVAGKLLVPQPFLKTERE
jgi:hypothetical protein